MFLSPIIRPVQCDNAVSVTGEPISALPFHKSGQDGNCWA